MFSIFNSLTIRFTSKMNYFLLVGFALLPFTQTKFLPDYLQEYICRKSDPKYEECLWNNLEKARPYVFKGIPELNLPPYEPFQLPLMTVNQTLNELVSIRAVLKNIKVTGMSKTIIEQVKANPFNHTGELRFTIPWTHLTMEYDVSGQMLIVPLRSKGFFDGNFTNTQIYLKGSLKTVDKSGEDYFRINKLGGKMRVGDGKVKLTSKNPKLQFAADLIANFYNENPRLVMDAINPIFVDNSIEVFRVIIDQVLATIPVKEWLPE